MVCVQTEGDRNVVNFVVDILQKVVPLMPHPSEGFLVSLEEDLIKLILSQDQVQWKLASQTTPLTETTSLCVCVCADFDPEECRVPVCAGHKRHTQPRPGQRLFPQVLR